MIVCMTAQEDFVDLFRDQVGPRLRAAGFKGSSPTWRRVSPGGDHVIVNVQRSQGNSADHIQFYLNLAVVPRAYWEFTPRRTKLPMANHGLLWRRLNPPPPHPTREWQLPSSECAAAVIERLDGVVPELVRLLDRQELAAFIRAGTKDWWLKGKPERVEAFAIVDDGPSPRLRELLDALDRQPHLADTSAWLRQRAYRT